MMAGDSVQTFQANGCAAGSGSYIVGDFALVKASVIFLQFNNVKSGRVAHTNHFIFPALLQWPFVFVPVNLERWRAIYLTVQAGIFPMNAFYWLWSFNKGWGLWKIYRHILIREEIFVDK